MRRMPGIAGTDAPTVFLCGVAAVAALLVARDSLAPLPVILAMLVLFEAAALLVGRFIAALHRQRTAARTLHLFEAIVSEPGRSAGEAARARVVRVAAGSELAARDLMRALGGGDALRVRPVAGSAHHAGVQRLGAWVPIDAVGGTGTVGAT